VLYSVESSVIVNRVLFTGVGLAPGGGLHNCQGLPWPSLAAATGRVFAGRLPFASRVAVNSKSCVRTKRTEANSGEYSRVRAAGHAITPAIVPVNRLFPTWGATPTDGPPGFQCMPLSVTNRGMRTEKVRRAIVGVFIQIVLTKTPTAWASRKKEGDDPQ
jgi:hypothetical protein